MRLDQYSTVNPTDCHSLPLIQILFFFDDAIQKKKLLISQELCGRGDRI